MRVSNPVRFSISRATVSPDVAAVEANVAERVDARVGLLDRDVRELCALRHDDQAEVLAALAPVAQAVADIAERDVDLGDQH